ncbi:MAG: hypothetical protein SW833_01545 [Cyanobacteriota bacterium]|nr:hypothetical protein [Cyanobacteriota bacterium]
MRLFLPTYLYCCARGGDEVGKMGLMYAAICRGILRLLRSRGAKMR